MKSNTTKRRRKLDLSPEQKAKSEQRRTRLLELVTEVKSMSKVAQQIENEKLGLIMSITGNPLSLFNSCFVRRQLASATTVGGFQQWKKAGRKVKKGSKAIAIWLPMKDNKDEGSVSTSDDEAITRFRLVNVFDISATEEA